MSPHITVVGGAYGEECCFPESRVYRGSGVRAACILSGLGNQIELNAVVGPRLAPEFRRIAARKGIVLRACESDTDIWFRYRHPLAKPDIYPPRADAIPLCDISANDALVYGMIEGRPTVTAKRAVYDPQDGFRSKPFDDNGSSADELAIVASWSEARAISGANTPADAATQLLSTPSCVAVVIKCGPQGALVATVVSQQWVYAFPSKRVWKIGSGDVFSAAYAHAWMTEKKTPLESAWFASRMVSAYVESRSEAFPPEQMECIRAEASAAVVHKTLPSARPIPQGQIYLAGPFFSTAQQWLVDEARLAFQDMGFKVFSPVHDVGRGAPNEVAPSDLDGLEKSELVFAVLDGLDSGTIFEVGYARAKEIPVIGVAETLGEQPLTMLLGSGCGITNDFATGVYAACWQLMKDV
ncbi:PfkB family carbohydrate kinase [Desulfovibrio aminophilus]|nr:PfkB family carbohydrate kinase [Desulfovibrio aminophilus]MCM0754813.1 PfkB family carbohydrate kinase [Desulfovibrio aminophilus]